MTVAADSDHHQRGIDAGEVRVAESPILKPTGTEVFHYDVALLDETLYDILPLGRAQINGYQGFVSEYAGCVERFAFCLASDRAYVIAHERLDLDDFRTEVREQPAAKWPGHSRAKFKHPVLS